MAVSRDILEFYLLLNRFDLDPIWTDKNGFANFFVFANIFDRKVRKIRLCAVLVSDDYRTPHSVSPTSRSASKRVVTYFANISAKTQSFSKTMLACLSLVQVDWIHKIKMQKISWRCHFKEILFLTLTTVFKDLTSGLVLPKSSNFSQKMGIF